MMISRHLKCTELYVFSVCFLYVFFVCFVTVLHPFKYLYIHIWYMFLHFSLCLLALEHLASWSAPTGASREALETTWKAPVAQSSAFENDRKTTEIAGKILPCSVWCLTYVFTRFVTSFHMFSIVFQNFREQNNFQNFSNTEKNNVNVVMTRHQIGRCGCATSTTH